MLDATTAHRIAASWLCRASNAFFFNNAAKVMFPRSEWLMVSLEQVGGAQAALAQLLEALSIWRMLSWCPGFDVNENAMFWERVARYFEYFDPLYEDYNYEGLSHRVLVHEASELTATVVLFVRTTDDRTQTWIQDMIRSTATFHHAARSAEYERDFAGAAAVY